MKQVVICLLGILILIVSSAISAEETPKPEAADSSEGTVAEKANVAPSEQIFVYYLHGNRRCATCKKLEAYSQEAVLSGFAEQLGDSVLVWQVVNYDEEDSKHYVKDYQLYTKALVLSKVQEGKEVQWKNLEKIWNLVGDKDEFITYVQTELQTFMKQAEE